MLGFLVIRQNYSGSLESEGLPRVNDNNNNSKSHLLGTCSVPDAVLSILHTSLCFNHFSTPRRRELLFLFCRGDGNLPEVLVGKGQSWAFSLGIADFKDWALSCPVGLSGWITPSLRFLPRTLGSGDAVGDPGG